MPNYKGHLVGGVVTYGLFLYVLRSYKPSFFVAFEWLIFCLAGSLFPDIDIKSKGQKYFYYLVFVLFLVLFSKQQFEKMACFSFIVVTPMLVRHRGIFHRTWFIIVMPLLAWWLIAVAIPSLSYSLLLNTLFFIAGSLSHIALDTGFRRMTRHFLNRRSVNRRKFR